MNKPELIYDSRGESGNIFWILGQVRRILQREHRLSDFSRLMERVQSSGSYEEALEIISEEVTLIDTAN